MQKQTPDALAEMTETVSRKPRLQSPGLLADSRRKKIIEWIQEEGSARVRNLAEAFSVTEATIRQDLEKLEGSDLIVREHGGAYLKSVPQMVRALALHHMVNMDQKKRIGRAAAALIHDGETVILDSGSTTTEIANGLLSLMELNVITNALNIALILGASPNISVHMTGGHFKPPTLSLTGEKAADYFHGIYAGKLFLATGAVSIEEGLTYPAMADIHIKKAMINAASHVYLVADSTKIGRTSFSSLGGIDLVHTLITDSAISNKHRAEFEAAGVEVIAV